MNEWGKRIFIQLFIGECILEGVSSQCSGSADTISVGYTGVTVSPPGYPNGYSVNMDCSWVVTSSVAGGVILFRVTDITLNCAGDAINVYDGSSSSGTQIHTNECQSGSSARDLSYRTATSGSVYISFISDSSTSPSELGFLMYTITGRDLSGTGCTTSEELTASSTEQFLTSPGFPNEYPNDQTCTWVISSQSNQKVYFEIRFMDIENDATCNYDYLEFIESGSIILKRCNTDTWNLSFNYTSEENNITVKFNSDNAVGERGFLIAFWETEKDTTTSIATVQTTTTEEKETTTSVSTVESTATKEKETTGSILTVLATTTKGNEMSASSINNYVIPVVMVVVAMVVIAICLITVFIVKKHKRSKINNDNLYRKERTTLDTKAKSITCNDESKRSSSRISFKHNQVYQTPEIISKTFE